MLLRFLSLFLLLLPSLSQAAAVEPRHGFDVLVFSRTEGYRHDSISAGLGAIQALASAHDFQVVATEDPGQFTDEGLADFAVVIFLNTTGDVLDDAEQEALQRFIAAGGGFVGVHAAADTEYGWPWYGELVGARFQAHPQIQSATVRVLDRLHPSTEGLPQVWERTDEWYDYQSNPRGDVHVLATLDPESYSGGGMGHDHPIAWCQPVLGGRSWYTGMGHTSESYSEPEFREHLLGGIEWAAGAVPGDCSATIGDNFELETLESDVDGPMDLAVLPDGSVLFVELEGSLRLYDAASGATTTVNQIPVFRQYEDGLLGIELDPNFAANGWVYLFYSPIGNEAVNRVSRFDWTGSDLDLASEQVLVDIGTQRDECCHSGGSMAFGPDGNLFIATGDNTNPFESEGYAPIDERSGRSAWDAQKSSSNTADLRGKILRIRPEDDGSYSIPDGNLFPGGVDGRAEIYAMGLRNPFRISVDPRRGWLYWGDVGPDASGDSDTYGPRGYDEWNQARMAGNFGWPYCVGPNLAYRDWNFDTRRQSGSFDCSAPFNDSPNNTGSSSLPAAEPAWIWYPYGTSDEFPGVTAGNGRTAMAGPVFQYNQENRSEGLPAYFDDRLIIYEWSRSYVLVVTMDEDGQPLSIDPLPGERTLAQPISIEQGPDGALYMLEWGTGFGTGNPDARLSRISYASNGRRPVALLDADVLSGTVPLTVQFSASRSFDPDGDPLTFAWDLDGDGNIDSTDESLTHVYTETGDYAVRLTATDPLGNESDASVQITAGNTLPEIRIDQPRDRGVAAWGDRIPFRLSVLDAEDGSTQDGSIDCDAVEVLVFIGHDAHTHPLTSTTGCEGEVQLAAGHGDAGDNLFHVIEFRYTDAGAGNAAPITVVEERVLIPNRIEAEHYAEHEGIQTEATTDPQGGGINIGWIDHGDWIRFDEIALDGIDFVTLRVASQGVGGTATIRRSSTTGPVVAKAFIANTGGWQNWRDVTVPVDDPGESGPLFLVFENSPGSSGLFNINFLRFHGPGVSTRTGDEFGFTAVHTSSPGSPNLVRHEPQLSFDWGAEGPLESRAAFSSTWEGTLQVPQSTTYSFLVRLQGSAHLYVDGQELASVSSMNQIGEFTSQSKRLRADTPADVRLTYQSGQDRSAIWVELVRAGAPNQTLGGELVYPPVATGVSEPLDHPIALEMGRPYPNPTNGDTRIDLNLPRAGEVAVGVFDILGRRVSASAGTMVSAGLHQLDLQTRGLAPGLYYIVVETPEGRLTRSVVKGR